MNKWITRLAMGLTLAHVSVFAGQQPRHEQLQMPLCLASKITVPHTVLAQDADFKIVDVLSSDIQALRIFADKVNCGHFVNVSHKLPMAKLDEKRLVAQGILHTFKAKSLIPSKSVSEVYEIKHQAEVEPLLKSIASDNIWQNLAHLTAYKNRSATKATGVEAAEWLKAQFEKMATEHGRTDTSTYLVETGWYKQPSVVTVIGKDIQAPAVVLGAHMDTLDGTMPGAGDDGSGSSTVLEAARVLLSSNIALKRPIYFIWYAAEERGLVGSQYVVSHFLEKSIPVKAVIQFDMTGYRPHPTDPTMWVFTDHVNKSLSNFVAQLIDTYVHVPVDYSRCGYGCSDHASWDDEGFVAAFPCESSFDEHNPYIHTSSDNMSLISLEHMTNFTKLAVAFATELALD